MRMQPDRRADPSFRIKLVEEAMTKILSLRGCLALAALAALPACSNGTSHSPSPSPSAAPRTTAAAAPVAPIPPAVTSDLIKQVQDKLHDAGYYKRGAVDGVYGRGTVTAVRSFQKDHDLTNSGKLDVPTLTAMDLAAPADQSAATANTNQPAATQPTGTNPPAADRSVDTTTNGGAPPGATNNAGSPATNPQSR